MLEKKDFYDFLVCTISYHKLDKLNFVKLF